MPHSCGYVEPPPADSSQGTAQSSGGDSTLRGLALYIQECKNGKHGASLASAAIRVENWDRFAWLTTRDTLEPKGGMSCKRCARVC